MNWPLVVIFVLGTYSNGVTAQSQSLEQVTKSIADQVNAKAARDGTSNILKATAVGKNITFEHVLQVLPDLSPSQVQQIDAAEQKEIIPKVCGVSANYIGFDRGMSYTVIYRSQYGKLLSTFIIDGTVCARFR